MGSAIYHKMAKCVMLMQYLLLAGVINALGSLNCNSSIPRSRKPFELKSAFSKYGLWPGLTNENDLKNGDTVYGLEEVAI